jgi:hypothetical protein
MYNNTHFTRLCSYTLPVDFDCVVQQSFTADTKTKMLLSDGWLHGR